jgi:hypothetical protein
VKAVTGPQQPTRTVALYLVFGHRAARSELTDETWQERRRGSEGLSMAARAGQLMCFERRVMVVRRGWPSEWRVP